MKRICKCFLLLLALVMTQANAVPTIVDDGVGKIIGISNLVIGQSIYNVSFSDTHFLSLWPGHIYDFSYQGALDAAAALSSFITPNNVAQEIYPSGIKGAEGL